MAVDIISYKTDWGLGTVLVHCIYYNKISYVTSSSWAQIIYSNTLTNHNFVFCSIVNVLVHLVLTSVHIYAWRQTTKVLSDHNIEGIILPSRQGFG